MHMHHITKFSNFSMESTKKWTFFMDSVQFYIFFFDFVAFLAFGEAYWGHFWALSMACMCLRFPHGAGSPVIQFQMITSQKKTFTTIVLSQPFWVPWKVVFIRILPPPGAKSVPGFPICANTPNFMYFFGNHLKNRSFLWILFIFFIFSHYKFFFGPFLANFEPLLRSKVCPRSPYWP